MALRVEAVEGRYIELCDETGKHTYPGKVVVLCDDLMYAAGTIGPGKRSGTIYDGVVGYSGPGGQVNNQVMEPGELAEGDNQDLKYLALNSPEKVYL